MKAVEIYTDGACSGNPGPGGWAAILCYAGREKEVFGSEAMTTNNRMELLAAIRGLEALKEPCRVALYSDSAYLIRAFTEDWIGRWQVSGWKTAANKPVENIDLWQALLDAVQAHEVTFHKVAGHSDHSYNERCDALARQESKRQRAALENLEKEEGIL